MSGGDGLTTESRGPDAAFLRTLVSHAAVGIVTFDADGRIVFANPAIEDVLGYAPDELVGRSTTDLVPKRLRSAPGSDLERFVHADVGDGTSLEVEFPALHRAGHEVPVSLSLGGHGYRGERVVTCVVSDVGDRKRREQSLIAENRELEEFADVLSHDLRNPLVVADNNVEAAREADDSEELRRVTAALDRLEQILDDTLVHTRRGATAETTETVTLHDMVQSAWDGVPTHDASLVVPDAGCRVRAHRGRLRQLVENLVRNAVEHAGRDVTVHVGVLDDKTGFYVEDDGPGLPASVRTRLESGRGAIEAGEYGFGLRIVGRIASEHGWTMRPTDAESGGARLEFRDATVSAR